MLNSVKRLKEKANIFIYDSQAKVLSTLKYLTFAAALSSIAGFIIYNGFEHEAETADLLINFIKGCFILFIVNYGVNFAYSFDKISFIKETWFEGLLILLLIYDGISLYLFNIPLLEITFNKLGFINFTAFYMLFIQGYILLLAAIELTRISQSFMKIRFNPIQIFIIAFTGVVIAGTFLLILPEMTVQKGSMNFWAALFTATSAVSVTGLQLVEVSSFFTFKGQLVLLLLIQTGGLLIISFASFFVIFLRKGVGISQQTAIADVIGGGSMNSSKQLIREILIYIGTIELFGTLVLFLLWDPEMQFISLGHKIFFSFFHAIAAFCNSGFSLLPNGLQNPYTANYPLIQMAFGGLILFGALGFPAIRDLLGISNLRERMRKPWKKWKTSTSISVVGAAFIIGIGAILFFLLESGSALQGQLLGASIINSVFHIISRTAGYATIDFNCLSIPTLLLLMLLMFIGGSSGSFAGGIKTSTFFILFISAISTIKGKKYVEFGSRTISFDLQNRANAILTFSAVCILLSVFSLSILEKDIPILPLVFESVSAFSISGWSMGITNELSNWGKLIITVDMFAGRLGILALAYAISSPRKLKHYGYPQAPVMVG